MFICVDMCVYVQICVYILHKSSIRMKQDVSVLKQEMWNGMRHRCVSDVCLVMAAIVLHADWILN